MSLRHASLARVTLFGLVALVRLAAAHAGPPAQKAPARQAEAAARLVALTDGAAHADPGVRRRASLLLAHDHSARGIALLYMLAHDVDADVQQTALASTLDRCAKETPTVCAAMIHFFVGDEDDSETHWQARDWLLTDDPEAATQAATLTYKLDVVARMGERADQPDLSAGALRVLRLLADDPEVEVQEAATAILLRAKL